ncbi:hypothetical protein DYB25_011146 [Aphanomyces astaci]|uniref:RxLR effector protein n=1 Tax=Aphanomyces astaci TaxID=112090 RepID=A0A397ANR6_APHAT|nr:hypothetical protein DYB25_011146 [Aphanomyces astaci]RHZ12692.1 hypothetical protein DYB31_010245 [Aphanomyces astaci]
MQRGGIVIPSRCHHIHSIFRSIMHSQRTFSLLLVLLTLLCAIAFGDQATSSTDDNQVTALRGLAKHYNELANTNDTPRNLLFSSETRGRFTGAFGNVRHHVRGAIDRTHQGIKAAVSKHAPKLNGHVAGLLNRAQVVGGRVANRIREATGNAKGHARNFFKRVKSPFGKKGGAGKHHVEPYGNN